MRDNNFLLGGDHPYFRCLGLYPFLGQSNYLINIAMGSGTFVIVSKDGFIAIKKKSPSLVKGLILLGRDEKGWEIYRKRKRTR
jgi:hypothetical protein